MFNFIKCWLTKFVDRLRPESDQWTGLRIPKHPAYIIQPESNCTQVEEYLFVEDRIQCYTIDPKIIVHLRVDATMVAIPDTLYSKLEKTGSWPNLPHHVGFSSFRIFIGWFQILKNQITVYEGILKTVAENSPLNSLL